MKFIWTSTYACTRAHVHIHLINKTYTLHAHMRIMCTRTVVELSHAAQARKHTRARTGCTCPVFIEAPVFQQERAAAHHQCHHQFSRSRSTHAAPKPAALNVNPTLQAPVFRCNPQTGTSAPCCRTLRPWMRICQDNIFATAHLAFVGCITRLTADCFTCIRDLTCHHAPHAFLCDYAKDHLFHQDYETVFPGEDGTAQGSGGLEQQHVIGRVAVAHGSGGTSGRTE